MLCDYQASLACVVSIGFFLSEIFKTRNDDDKYQELHKKSQTGGQVNSLHNISIIEGSEINMPQHSERGIGPRFKNIHAKHFSLDLKYVPPTYDKSESTRLFLQNCLKENFIFSTLQVENIPALINAFKLMNVNSWT